VTWTADVVVVGGGLVGCATARELARRGLRTTILERGELAGEASRAAAGMVAPQAETDRPGPLLRLAVQSRERYPQWVAQLQEESGLDVEYRTDGILYVALDTRDARALGARARWQRQLGLRVEAITIRAARRMAPVLPSRLHLALHFPDDHRVNNERLAVAAGVAARRSGVDIHEHAQALCVEARRGRVTGVRSDAGVIATRVVVNAAGAWAADLGLPAGVVAPPVFPVRGQMLVLRGAPEALALPLYTRRAYLVPRPDGRVLLGSTRERAGFEKRVTMGAAAELLAAAAAMAPGLADLSVAGAYAGLRPGTPDELPILGPARDLQGLFYATGLYRSGILLAPATATALADLIADGCTALPLRGLGPRRMARVPGHLPRTWRPVASAPRVRDR
jgi:glycine oxidase